MKIYVYAANEAWLETHIWQSNSRLTKQRCAYAACKAATNIFLGHGLPMFCTAEAELMILLQETVL